MRMLNILPNSFVLQSVPVHGITQLGLRSHPTGSVTMRPLQQHFCSLGLTNWYTPLCRSDPLVLAILLRQWQDLSFLTSGIPIRPFQAELTILTDASTQGWGAHMGDSQISGIWTLSVLRLRINTLELKAVILALHHWVSVLRGHQVTIATDNTTVVAYIHKQGGTHSHTLLEATNSKYNHPSQTHSGLFKCDSRQDISAEPAHHNRMESRPRNSEPNLWDVGNSSSGHVYHSPQHTSSPVYVSCSCSGAPSTGDRCSVIRLAGEVDVHVSIVVPALSSFSEAQ